MKLEEYLGEKLGKSQGMDEEGVSVLVFGLAVAKSMVLSFLGIILVGILVGQLLGTLVIAVTQALLKQITGGPHCSDEYRCTVSGMLVFGVLGYISPFIWPHLSFAVSALLLLPLFVSILAWAPRDCPEKPIDSPAHRRRLRNLGLIAAVGLAALLYCLYAYNQPAFAAWVVEGALWQAVLLSPLGVWFIHGLDRGMIKAAAWFSRRSAGPS
ncbi:MAG: accessory gene regulator B family protein [Firmicutes bacterium]|nr:accessory gene regulator B family protein [Bacillota bacterium]